jgi:hypothetical protein
VRTIFEKYYIFWDIMPCNLLEVVGQPEGKRPPGRPRRRWVNNIKMDLREKGWDGMGWLELAQDRDQWRALVNRVMDLCVS